MFCKESNAHVIFLSKTWEDEKLLKCSICVHIRLEFVVVSFCKGELEKQEQGKDELEKQEQGKAQHKSGNKILAMH